MVALLPIGACLTSGPTSLVSLPQLRWLGPIAMQKLINDLRLPSSESLLHGSAQSGHQLARVNFHEPSGCRFMTRMNVACKLAGACSSDPFCTASKYPHS